MSSSRALLFLSSSSSSSFRPRLFLCRSLFLFVLLLFLLFFSRKSSARERETRAREEINARKFRTKTKRRLCVFSVVAVDDFFLLLSLLRCVSFKRTKDQPTNTKEEALKVFLCVCIYIYITRGNESRCCVLRARVSLYSSS